MAIGARDRFMGAWWGAFLGDAIASPSHGYSSEALIKKDYGLIDDFIKPKDEYPENLMSGIKVPELSEEFDCLSNRRKIWRIPHVHPHRGLEAGESTLPLVLALHLAASISESGGRFDCDKWLERYRAVMTSPGGHRDMFIPSVHRRYFENLSAKKDPQKNGCPDAHVGDIATYIPIILLAQKNLKSAQMNLFKVLRYFTIGESASSSAFFISEVVSNILKGSTLEETIYSKMTPDRHFALAFPYRRWIKNGTNAVNTLGRFATLDEGIPLVLYLSLKHQNDLGGALIENANIGGETTGRGAFIGMLIGAEIGKSEIPDGLVNRLSYCEEIQAAGDALFKIASSF